MKILKLWVVTSCTVAERNMLPSSSGKKNGMESFTKMFIPTYQIMWCHIVNSDETHIQRVLRSPNVVSGKILWKWILDNCVRRYGLDSSYSQQGLAVSSCGENYILTRWVTISLTIMILLHVITYASTEM
jgi:hypothetical protein